MTIATSFAAVMITGCKKFLEIPAPSTSVNQENVYQHDYTAAAVLTGIYTQVMSNFSNGGATSISLIAELSADNLAVENLNIQSDLTWWRNMVTADYINNGGYNNYFATIYPNIYTVNAALEGITKSKSLSQDVKKRLLGESYFLRAFFYFYLVNLFGDVPLITSTDYMMNSSIKRSPSSVVYQQIIDDLKKSKTFLDDNYLDGNLTKVTSERVRPNLSACLALLARVQLFTSDFKSAEATSSEIINNSSLYSLVEADSVFKKNSKETIWALQPVKQSFNTDEGYVYILNAIPGTQGLKNYYLSNSLMSNFEKNDKRLSSWTNTFTDGSKSFPFSYKYKADISSSVVSEYCIVLRLAEQYLIRAEARLNQNNIDGAKDDLNSIRLRAGLDPITVTSRSQLQKAILNERRIELFTEWGHRWFDLKRTGSIDSVMQKEMQIKGGSWASYKSLFPIPNSEILLNKNLTQNIGY